jgi:thiol-disulfide isomerase/thioredoxin
MKELDGDTLKKEIKSGKPIAIFFYMNGCPHCDKMKKPWDDLEKEVPHTDFCKIESAKVPSEMGITGFPHFEVHTKSKKKKVVDGSSSKEELKKKLFGTGGRRRTRRGTLRFTRRVRKSKR